MILIFLVEISILVGNHIQISIMKIPIKIRIHFYFNFLLRYLHKGCQFNLRIGVKACPDTVAGYVVLGRLVHGTWMAWEAHFYWYFYRDFYNVTAPLLYGILWEPNMSKNIGFYRELM